MTAAGRGKARTVPGAAPRENADSSNRKASKKGKQQQQAQSQSNPQQDHGQPAKDLVDTMNSLSVSVNGASAAPPATPSKAHALNGLVSEGSAASPLTPEDKKRRALQKKLGAIEALKARRNAGEKLEKTQEKKIEAEAEVRKELADLP